MAGVDRGIVSHALSAGAAASASAVEIGSWVAVHALLSVPDGEGGRADFAVAGGGVFVGEGGGAVAGVVDGVPDGGGVAGDAFLGVHVVVGGGGVAETLGLVGIEGESGRAAGARL